MNGKAVVVVGAGSVGRRHLRNLVSLGWEGIAVDPREDRLQQAAGEVHLKGAYAGMGEALSAAGQGAPVVIASPPSVHVEQGIFAIQAGSPLFMEKPVGLDIGSARKLLEVAEASQAIVVLGYTYRWWPALQHLRTLVREGAVGRPLSARCVLSAHLADWHPWERYQDFFMAKKALGGGALLDESHFIDLMLWFFGSPVEVWANVGKVSDLDIETDDHVDAWLRFSSGLQATIHLDLYGRPHERSVTVVGSEGSLQWDWEGNVVRICKATPGDVIEKRFPSERNQMFIDAISEFLGLVRNGGESACTLRDGVEVMRVVEAVRVSSDQRRVVSPSLD